MSSWAATRQQRPDPANMIYILARWTERDTASNRSRYRYEKQRIGNMVKGGTNAKRMMLTGVMVRNGVEVERRTLVKAKGM